VTLESGGETETVVVPLVIVATDDPGEPEEPGSVAVIVTLGEVGTTFGAVYKPLPSIAPWAPSFGVTAQTTVPEPLVMEAVKLCWVPVLTVGFCGKTCTIGGLTGGAVPPPPPPTPAQDVSEERHANQASFLRTVLRPVRPRNQKPGST